MTIFDILLQIIKKFTLTDTESWQQLKADTKEWESDTLIEGQTDKLKVMYGKLHKGVLLRLLNPIFFFLIQNWILNLGKPANGDDWED